MPFRPVSSPVGPYQPISPLVNNILNMLAGSQARKQAQARQAEIDRMAAEDRARRQQAEDFAHSIAVANLQQQIAGQTPAAEAPGAVTAAQSGIPEIGPEEGGPPASQILVQQPESAVSVRDPMTGKVFRIPLQYKEQVIANANAKAEEELRRRLGIKAAETEIEESTKAEYRDTKSEWGTPFNGPDGFSYQRNEKTDEIRRTPNVGGKPADSGVDPVTARQIAAEERRAEREKREAIEKSDAAGRETDAQVASAFAALDVALSEVEKYAGTAAVTSPLEARRARSQYEAASKAFAATLSRATGDTRISDSDRKAYADLFRFTGVGSTAEAILRPDLLRKQYNDARAMFDASSAARKASKNANAAPSAITPGVRERVYNPTTGKLE